MKLTTYLHLEPLLRISGVIPVLPYMPSQRGCRPILRILVDRTLQQALTALIQRTLRNMYLLMGMYTGASEARWVS